jgi:tRNA modification GTPase
MKFLISKASSDLLAFELKAAVQSIGDISGLISNDEVLGYIFGKFCIGK